MIFSEKELERIKERASSIVQYIENLVGNRNEWEDVETTSSVVKEAVSLIVEKYEQNLQDMNLLEVPTETYYADKVNDDSWMGVILCNCTKCRLLPEDERTFLDHTAYIFDTEEEAIRSIQSIAKARYNKGKAVILSLLYTEVYNKFGVVCRSES